MSGEVIPIRSVKRRFRVEVRLPDGSIFTGYVSARTFAGARQSALVRLVHEGVASADLVRARTMVTDASAGGAQ